MAKNSPLTFVVSQEELSVLLAYLKTKSMVGLDLDIFKGLEEKQIQLVLGVAERALIARGFLARGSDNHLKMEPPIFATVGACAFPESTILVSNTRPNALEGNYYFHTSRKMIVMHTIPMIAMHQFIAVEDKSTVTKAVFSILHLDSTPGTPYPEGKITRAILNKAREAAHQKGSKTALSILSSQGRLDEKTARAFAETLAHPLSNTMLAYVEKQGKLAEGCSILQGEKSLWWLAPADEGHDENAVVSIKSVSAREAKEQVTSLLRL